MRLRLLLILVVAIAGMGADCGGGSDHSDAATSSSSVSVASTGESKGGDFAPAVPEPSALLVFGAGLLLAGAATRRNR